MGLFEKIANSLMPLIIFAKNFILDILLGFNFSTATCSYKVTPSCDSDNA